MNRFNGRPGNIVSLSKKTVLISHEKFLLHLIILFCFVSETAD